MPWLGTSHNDFLTSLYFLFFPLSSLIECLFIIAIKITAHIAFVSTIVFKLGAWSDFMHYTTRFSTMYSHGQIKVDHQNISVVRIRYHPDKIHDRAKNMWTPARPTAHSQIMGINMELVPHLLLQQPSLFREGFLWVVGTLLQGFVSIQPQEHEWGWAMMLGD